MAKPRSELGLPELLLQPDPSNGYVDLTSLSATDRMIYGFQTATSRKDLIIHGIVTYMYANGRVDRSDPDRPKLCVGTYKDDPTVKALLGIKLAGGKNVKSENIITPIITAGKVSSGQPRQIPLDEHINTRIAWDVPGLDIKQWLMTPSNKAIGITNKHTRSWTWKRALVRVWAASFPDCPIHGPGHSNKNNGIGGATRGSSSKKRRASHSLLDGRMRSGSRQHGNDSRGDAQTSAFSNQAPRKEIEDEDDEELDALPEDKKRNDEHSMGLPSQSVDLDGHEGDDEHSMMGLHGQSVDLDHSHEGDDEHSMMGLPGQSVDLDHGHEGDDEHSMMGLPGQSVDLDDHQDDEDDLGDPLEGGDNTSVEMGEVLRVHRDPILSTWRYQYRNRQGRSGMTTSEIENAIVECSNSIECDRNEQGIEHATSSARLEMAMRLVLVFLEGDMDVDKDVGDDLDEGYMQQAG